MRRAWLPLIGLVAVAAAAWLWDAVHFPAGHERLAGTPVDLRAEQGVPERDRAAVREGILLEHRFLQRRLGGGPRRPIEARIARSHGCRAFERSGGGTTGTAERGFLCVDTHVPVWNALRDRPLRAALVSAHEYVHTWQAELGCLPGPRDHTHLWLIEGMASHLAWQAAIDAGRADAADARAYTRELGGERAGLPPLQTFERRSGDDAAYALWQIAVRALVARAPGGDRALRDFCVAVGGGTPWEAAFATAFGERPETFYDRFAAAPLATQAF